MSSFKELAPFIKANLWLSKWSNCNALEWDGGEFKPVNWRTYKLLCIMFYIVIYNIAICLRMYAVLREEDAKGGGFINNIPAVLIAFILVGAGHGLGFLAFRKSEEIAQFYNALTLFEETEYGGKIPKNLEPKIFSEGKLTMLKKIENTWSRLLTFLKQNNNSKDIAPRMIMTAAIYTQILCPIMISAFLVMAPCSLKSFLRSTLTDCPNSGGYLPTIEATPAVKFSVICLDIFAYIYGQSAIATVMTSYFYVGVLCVRQYITRIKTIFEKDSLKKETKNGSIRQQVETFQRVKLLEQLFNGINQRGMVPLILTDVALMSILCLYGLIALHASYSTPLLMHMILMATDALGIVQTLMYKAAGDVNQRSNDLRSAWHHSRTVLKNKYLRRYVKGCNAMKIRMGNNFLEKDTPVTITQFTVEQAIGLVLINKR